MFNPQGRGWLQYYGRYYRSALYPIMRQLDRSLARWAYRKDKKLRGHKRGRRTGSHGFPGGTQGCVPTGRWACGGAHSGSRMSGDVHVRFCEGVGVRLPRATHLSYSTIPGKAYNDVKRLSRNGSKAWD